MFTGIIEQLGEIVDIQKKGTNVDFYVKTPFYEELKIDQSIAHNGACLTVVSLNEGVYVVTAVLETLKKTNLNQLKVGDRINLERALKVGDRLDGHFVQGHVDTTAKCIDVSEVEGSWLFTFEYDPQQDNHIIEKGSVCINGVSLTCFNTQKKGTFSVTIIPYTYEHTTFQYLKPEEAVNIEFDLLGKFILAQTSLRT